MTELTTHDTPVDGLTLQPSNVDGVWRAGIRPDVTITSSYTSQPAPDQWIAVATVALPPQRQLTTRVRLIVGVGASETEALAQLRERIEAVVEQSG